LSYDFKACYRILTIISISFGGKIMITHARHKIIYLIVFLLNSCQITATNIPNFDRLLAELTVIEPKINAILSNQQAYSRTELRRIIYNVNKFCEKLRDTVSSIDNQVYNHIFDTLALTISSPECDNNKIMDDLLAHYNLTPTSINRCKFSITMINNIARYIRTHKTIYQHDYPTLCDSIMTALNVTSAEIKDISVWMDNHKSIKKKKWLNKRNLSYLFGLLSVTLTIAVGIGGYFHLKSRLKQTLASAQEHAVQQRNMALQQTDQQIQMLNNNMQTIQEGTTNTVTALNNKVAKTMTNITSLQTQQTTLQQRVNHNNRVVTAATNAFQEEAHKQHEALERQHTEVNRVFEKMGSVAQDVMREAPEPSDFLRWLTKPLGIKKPAQFTQLIASVGTLFSIGTQVVGMMDNATRGDEDVGYSAQEARLYERLQDLRTESQRPPTSVYGM